MRRTKGWLGVGVLLAFGAGCGGSLIRKDATTSDASRDGGADIGSKEAGLPDGAADRGATDLPARDVLRADLDPTLSALEVQLSNLPADSWYELPSSKLRPLCAPESFGVKGVMGCTAAISAWSGGTWDPLHRKFLIWGGGHNDYWGNEVYAFDLRTGQWERLTDPSPGPFDQDPLADGNPVSRHTYDGLTYITHADRFFGHGGSRAKDGNGTSLTWAFDVGARVWQNRAPTTAGPGGYSLTATYDPASKLVFTRSTKNLQVYDYDQNSWTVLEGFGFAPLWPRYEVSGDKSSTIDTKRGLFWSVGSGDVLVWDIAAKALVTESWKTTGGGAYSNAARIGGHSEQLFESGGGDIFDAGAPGFDYDSKMDQIVAWKGGAAYVLDLASKSWSIKSATGAPTQPVSHGSFGRFAYLPHVNVFILINGVDANVTFYKNGPGGA